MADEKFENEEFEEIDPNDIVEFEDEDGNTITMQIVQDFYYNGDEYVVMVDLADVHEHGCCCEECEKAEGEDACEEEPLAAYIMKVEPKVVDGEEVEEFVEVEDEELYQKLCEIADSQMEEDEDFDD